MPCPPASCSWMQKCQNPWKILHLDHGYSVIHYFNLFKPHVRNLEINLGVTEPVCPSSVTVLHISLSLIFSITCRTNLNIETGWLNLAYQDDQDSSSVPYNSRNTGLNKPRLTTEAYSCSNNDRSQPIPFLLAKKQTNKKRLKIKNKGVSIERILPM